MGNHLKGGPGPAKDGESISETYGKEKGKMGQFPTDLNKQMVFFCP